MEVRDEEFADAEEMAAAADPEVGAGTADSAPHETPFDDDDEALTAAADDGVADDDDELDEEDDDTPIDEDV
jgi:hypothetical protein